LQNESHNVRLAIMNLGLAKIIFGRLYKNWDRNYLIYDTLYITYRI